jgi:hypothetical protein
MSLDDGSRRWRVHQVIGGTEVELIEEAASERNSGGRPELRLLVNLRAEGDAEALQQIVHRAFKTQEEAQVTFDHEAAFQPGKPVPTHRIA